MTDTTRRSKPAPANLKQAGKTLWANTTREFDLNPAELALLHELCCVKDELVDLKAALATSRPVVKGSKGQPRPNPLLAELRNHRKLADQLVTALGLPLDGEVVGRRRSAQAKRAVETRWRKTGNRVQRLGLVAKDGS